MKQIILTFGLILCGSVLFGQSPRIRLNQITKDSLTGSVVLSGSDSNMVYSRDFFLNLTDSVLILFGDTLSTTATAFTGVATDLTLTGNGTVGNELKVDTAVIATVSALADSLAGIISSVNTDLTLTGDGSIATPLKVDTSVIATIRALADSVATRGTVTSVAVAAGTGISVSGSPITTSGTITVTNTAPDQTVALTGGTGITTSGTYPNFTINNSAPDQTVSITGAGINAVTGTYPNFTITGTEVDGSTTNELQTISTTGAAGNITLSNGGGTLNLNVNDADASATNEGSLSVGAGGANSSDIVSNTSGSTNVTIAGGSNVTVTESGSTITIASTAGGTGTVTDITAGTFLSGGTITTSGTIALDTASAGLKTYISQNSAGTGTVTSVAVSAGTGISISGSPITTSGTITVTNTAPNATHTGDVTGSSALTIANDAVTNAKMANMAQNTIKGRITASTGDPEDLTASQVRTILNVADGATANTGTVTSVSGTGTVNGISLSGTVTSSGNLTLGGTLSNVNLASQVTGTLPVANGGTGATTLTSGAFLKGNGTSAISGSSNLTEIADTVFVAKYLHVDTSTLYVDADLNRVGIGIASSFNADGNLYMDRSLIPTEDKTGVYGLTITDSANVNNRIALYNYNSLGATGLEFNNDLGTGLFTFYGSNSVSPSVYNLFYVKNEVGSIKFLANTGNEIGFGVGTVAADANDLTIKSDGKVGIGTTAPGSQLHTKSATSNDALLVEDDSGACEAQPTTTGLTWSCSSDQRLKTDIQIPAAVLNYVKNIPLKDYTVIKTAERVMGPIAQELLETYPELVTTGEDGYYRVSSLGSWTLVKAIQEQQAIIESQKAEIDQLKTQIQNILIEINNLKNN